jgi:hypothetical protein
MSVRHLPWPIARGSHGPVIMTAPCAPSERQLPVLHKRRKWQEALAAREAAGESFWTDKFVEPARNKILLGFRTATGDSGVYADVARGLILRDEGFLYLSNPQWDASEDLYAYILQCDKDMVPTVIEAMSLACSNRAVIAQTGNWDAAAYFDETVNVTLLEHRISYELVNHQMIEFSSKALHQNVIAPASRLLGGRPDLDKIESAYSDALREISKGSPADAITDAGTALQEMLSAVGCEGKSLGDQLKSARTKKIIAAHDSPLITAIEKTVSWVSADRSEKGDAHSVTSATVDDAWLIVQIVGALILRLSKSAERG